MSSLLFLLCGGFVLLLGLAVSGTSLDRARLQAERRRARIDNFVVPHREANQGRAFAPVTLIRAEERKLSLTGKLGALFGILPGQADFYPVPPIVLVVIAAMAAVIAGWLAAALAGQLGWFTVPLGTIFLSRTILHWFEKRRTTLLFKQFPDALAMIVRGVRVGIPIADSVRAVATEASLPTALEFRRLSDELAIGTSLEEALRMLARRNKLQEYRFFATALALQSQTGGRLGETLENLADTIRKRVMVRARGHALAAETRTSSGVLAVLPFIAFGGLMLLNPAYAMVLIVDHKGHAVLAAAILTLGSGLFLMRTMINRALS